MILFDQILSKMQRARQIVGVSALKFGTGVKDA